MTTPIRVAYDARYINDRYHGVGRFAFRLLEALADAAWRTSGITLVVFRGQGQDSRFDWSWLATRANVEVRDGPWPMYWPQEQLYWPRLLRDCRADLFYSPYFVAPLLAPLPAVVTVHDLIFDRYPQYMPWIWARPYYRILMALSTRRARRVVAVSQATAEDLRIYYHLPRQSMAVVQEGVDPGFSPPDNEEQLQRVRKRYRLQSPFILSVGVRRPHKNLARLVRAFAGLEPDLAQQLVFAGPPDPRFPDHARMVAQQLGLDGRVRFLGWVAEADLPGLYALASVVVCPSLMEGFGLPALEAMACGAPVVAANISSLPEVVGEAGVLVDPTDEGALAATLAGLLRDQPRLAQLSAAGREKAAAFTWEKAALNLLAVLESARKGDTHR